MRRAPRGELDRRVGATAGERLGLAEAWDAILLVLGLPDRSGLDVFTSLRAVPIARRRQLASSRG